MGFIGKARRDPTVPADQCLLHAPTLPEPSAGSIGLCSRGDPAFDLPRLLRLSSHHVHQVPIGPQSEPPDPHPVPFLAPAPHHLDGLLLAGHDDGPRDLVRSPSGVEADPQTYGPPDPPG